MDQIFFLNVNTTSPFNCSTVQLPAVVQVQPGDILGACVGRRQGNDTIRQQLNLAGDNVNGFSVVSGASVQRCNLKNLRSLRNIAVTDLVEMPGRFLHVSAELSKYLYIIATQYFVASYPHCYVCVHSS